MQKAARIIAIALGVFPLALSAQDHEHAGHEARSEHADGRSHVAALTAEQVAQLQAGDGMGLARAAELNSYPGPKHLLELADALELSAEQRGRIEGIRQDMLDAAIRLGNEILAAEEEMDLAFRDRSIDETALGRHVERIALLQGRLRAVHLVAHLESAVLLTEQQIQAYDTLRGYR